MKKSLSSLLHSKISFLELFTFCSVLFILSKYTRLLKLDDSVFYVFIQIILLVFLIVLVVSAGTNYPFRIRINILFCIPIFLFLLSSFLSLLISLSMQISEAIFYGEVLDILLFFYMLAFLKDISRIIKLLTCISFIIFVLACITISGFSAAYFSETAYSSQTQSMPYIGATFGNPLHLIPYLGLGFPLVLSLFALNLKHKSLHRLYLHIAMIAVIVGIFLNFKKSGLLMFIASIFTLYIFSFDNKAKFSRLCIYAALFICIFLFWYYKYYFFSFFRGINPRYYMYDSNVFRLVFSIRPANWGCILHVVKDYSFLGAGMGTFSEIYPYYSRYCFSGYSDSWHQTLLTMDFPHAHNIYLHRAVENGFLGLFSLLFLVIFFLMISKKVALSKQPDHKILGIGISSSLAGFFVFSFFENSLHSGGVDFIFWSLMAAEVRIYELSRESFFKERPANLTHWKERFTFLCLLVILALYGILYNLGLYHDQKGMQYGRAKDWKRSSMQFQQCLKFAPWSIRCKQSLADIHYVQALSRPMDVKQTRKVIVEYEKILKYEFFNKEIIKRLVQLNLRIGAPQKAKQLLKRYENYP